MSDELDTKPAESYKALEAVNAEVVSLREPVVRADTGKV